jgi:hypothetical protein
MKFLSRILILSLSLFMLSAMERSLRPSAPGRASWPMPTS